MGRCPAIAVVIFFAASAAAVVGAATNAELMAATIQGVHYMQQQAQQNMDKVQKLAAAIDSGN
jgi:ABC-type phosphate/phosphonate transport system substrate-binding protein